MPIIDTHLHLIDPKRHRYPWLAGHPDLNREYALADYWRAARPLGVTACLHMEVDVAEADMAAEARWASELGAPITAVIAACRPESSGFAAYLDEISTLTKLRGLRRILHTSPDELSQRPLFAQNIRRLAPHHLPFDICILARQLPLAFALATACPDVQFVLDHCGGADFNAETFSQWRDGILEIAALPNVACKMSGIIALGPQARHVDQLRPVVEHCIGAFGWGRVVWGSDYPVTAHGPTLAAWVAATHAILAGCSPSEKEALLCTNAARLYCLANADLATAKA